MSILIGKSEMLDFLLYLLLSSFYSWLGTKLILWLHQYVDLYTFTPFIYIANFLQSCGFSVRKVVFAALIILFMSTGICKKFPKLTVFVIVITVVIGACGIVREIVTHLL